MNAKQNCKLLVHIIKQLKISMRHIDRLSITRMRLTSRVLLADIIVARSADETLHQNKIKNRVLLIIIKKIIDEYSIVTQRVILRNTLTEPL